MNKIIDYILKEAFVAKWAELYQNTSTHRIIATGILSFDVSKDIKLNGIYYHGTTNKSAFDNIIKNGLDSKNIDTKDKYKDNESLKPMLGNYITKDLGNAVRYSFMSNNDDWNSVLKNEPYGYVFVFDSKQIKNAVPDEDEIGNIVIRILKNTPKLKERAPIEILEIIKKPQLDFKDNASLGKWFIENAKDSLVQYLYKNNPDLKNLVVQNKLIPVGYYKVKKPSTRFLGKQNLQTFDVYLKYLKNNSVYIKS